MEKKLLALILFIPLVSISLTLFVLNAGESKQSQIDFPEQNNKKVADTFFNNATIIDYGENGRPSSKIIGDQLFHYPGEDDSEIIKPKVTFFRDTGSPVFVTADHGWINQAGTRVLLKGHTVIVREKSEANKFSKLETPELIIWPEKEYAETDQDVKITTDGTVATGTGMKAYIDKEHYFLLNRVRGRHTPAQSGQ